MSGAKLLAEGVPLPGRPYMQPVDLGYVQTQLRDAYKLLRAELDDPYRDHLNDAAFHVGRMLPVRDNKGALVVDEAKARKKLIKIAMRGQHFDGTPFDETDRPRIKKTVKSGFAAGRLEAPTVVVTPRPPTPEEKRIADQVAYLIEKDAAQRIFRDRNSVDRVPLANRLLSPAQLASLPGLVPLIEGILFQENVAMLFGLPGSYKSFLAIAWACSVATGKDWMGRKVAKGPVLYVAAEGSAGLSKRVEAWSIGWNKGKPVDGLYFLAESIDLTDAEGHVAELAALNAEHGYALIVIDTYARSTGGEDENLASSANAILSNIETIKRAHKGTTVLLAHHRGKTGTDPRGSNALLGGVDTALSISGDKRALTLEATKQKDIEGGIVEHLEASGVESAESLILRRKSGSLSTFDELPAHLEASLAHLHRGFAETGASRSEAKTFLVNEGVDPNTAYRHITKLIEAKQIVLVGTNKLTFPKSGDRSTDLVAPSHKKSENTK